MGAFCVAFGIVGSVEFDVVGAVEFDVVGAVEFDVVGSVEFDVVGSVGLDVVGSMGLDGVGTGLVGNVGEVGVVDVAGGVVEFPVVISIFFVPLHTVQVYVLILVFVLLGEGDNTPLSQV